MITVQNRIFIFIISIFFLVNNCSAGDNSNINKFTISPQMKKHIMNSPFKVSLHRGDGKKIIAYLYAEDEQSDPHEYNSCLDGEEYKTIAKTGHYYIYLYDISSDAFFPNRTAVFYDSDGITMNTEGANFFVWSNTNKNKPDVIFISQFVACNGDQYEAYGFIKNRLKKYTFSGKRKDDAFYGRIEQLKKYNGNLLAYSIYNEKIHQIKLSLSTVPGEIKLVTLKVNRL